MSTKRRARPPSSRRTRRCCGNGACWRDGSPKTPDCLPCWRASNGRAAIGRRTTATAHGSRTRQIGWPRPSGSLRGPTSPPTWSRRIANTLPHAGRPRRTRDAASGSCRPRPTAHWLRTDRPFLAANMWPYLLTRAAEQALKPDPNQSFRECAPKQQDKDYCPDMVVVPAGSFMMGSPPTEKDRYSNEDPQHMVTIGKRFAVAKFALTFDEWDTCVAYGDCPQGVTDSGFGRGQRPVINVTWDDAQRYVAWFRKMTGKPYRLLTEAEYEYATRAGTQTAYPWGDDIGQNNANCNRCGSKWDGSQAAPVGSFEPNAFGLYDMVGNVFEWVEDCTHGKYVGAPTDGSAWIEGGNCNAPVIRSGPWNEAPDSVRSANRNRGTTDVRSNNLGFRVARTLIAP